MQYLIGEIFFCMVAAAMFAGAIGALLHSIFGQGRIRAIESTKNLEIERITGDLEAARRGQMEAKASSDAAIARIKELENKLRVGETALAAAVHQHESEQTRLKSRIAELEPLKSDLADRDARLEGWQKRMDGAMADKDSQIAALRTELASHKTKVEALGASLVAAGAVKEGLDQQIADHKNSIAAWESHLRSITTEKDSAIDAATSRVKQLENELGVVGSRLAATEAARSQAVETLNGRESSLATAQANLAENAKQLAQMAAARTDLQSRLDESLRQHHLMMSATQSMKLALDGKDQVISSHASRLADLEPQLATHVEQIGQVRAQLADSEASVSKLKALVGDLEPLRGVIADREARLAGREQTIADLNQTIAALNLKSEALDREVSDSAALKNQLANSALMISSRDARIAELEAAHLAKLGDFNGKLNHAALLVSSRDARIDELESAHLAKLTELKNEIAHSSALASLREARLAELEAAHSNQLNELNAKLKQDELLIGSRDARIAELEAAHVAKLAELTARLSQDGLMIRSRDARIEELESAHSARVVEFKRLMGELQGAFSAKDARIAELDAASSRSTELQQRIDELIATITERDQRLAELESVHASNLAESEHHANRLKEQMAEVESAHSDRVIAFENLIAELRGSISKKDAWMSQVDQAQTQRISELEAAVAGLRETLAQKDQAQAQAEAQRGGDVELLRQSQADRDTALAQIRSYESQLADAQRHQDEIERALGAIQIERDNATASANAYAARLADLEAAHAVVAHSHSDRLSELQAMHDALHAEKAQMIVWYETRLVEVQSATPVAANLDQEEILTRDREIESLRGQISELKAALQHEEQERQHNLAEAEALVAVGLDQKNREIELLRRELAAALRSSGGIAPVSVAADPELGQMRIRLEEWEARFNRLNADGERREAELRSRIAARDEELNELRAQVADRDERIEAWESRFQAADGDWNARLAELQKNGAQPAPLAMAASVGSASVQAQAVSAPVFTADARVAASQDLRRFFTEELHLRGIQFLPASAELIPQSLEILQKAADALHQHGDVSVEIAGHTDSWGDPQSNFALSQQRAASVKEFLINRGVPAWRLIDIGYGDTQPVQSNDTPDGRFANRRIEFHVRG